MLFRLPLEVLLLLLPVLLFALVFHEFSHAYVAFRLGDRTAQRMGRLTLNPLVHLDPFGALMILLVGFGWAKPVPVDTRNLRQPRTDMMKIAFAGPGANLLLAALGGSLIRLLGVQGALGMMLLMFTQINIALAVFNMLPVPPLDGSQIFSGLLVRHNPELVMKMQAYGPRILLGVILVGYFTGYSLIWTVMRPVVNMFMVIFTGI